MPKRSAGADPGRQCGAQSGSYYKWYRKNHTDTSGFCFCTDDKHIEEIRREGHINYNVKRAVQLGLAPEKALKMATIQAARCYGLKHLGAIAPGYQADLVVLDNLRDMNVPKSIIKA